MTKNTRTQSAVAAVLHSSLPTEGQRNAITQCGLDSCGSEQRTVAVPVNVWVRAASSGSSSERVGQSSEQWQFQ